MKKNDILEILKKDENYDAYHDFLRESWIDSSIKIENLDLKVKYIDGGGEGQGDSIELVFSVNNESLFRVFGEHDSWDGNRWDNIFDITEVVPAEKTIIVYEDVK